MQMNAIVGKSWATQIEDAFSYLLALICNRQKARPFAFKCLFLVSFAYLAFAQILALWFSFCRIAIKFEFLRPAGNGK